MMRLATLLIISIVVAVASAMQPVFFRWPDSTSAMHLRIYGPVAIWLVLLVVTLVLHGKRGLWVLVGAPFALFGPTMWTLFYIGCVLRWFKVECP